jgi:hypothetical protein
MAVVLIAGCTGGMGSILLSKIDTGGRFQGRKVGLLICLDYFPGDSDAGVGRASSASVCRAHALRRKSTPSCQLPEFYSTRSAVLGSR